MVLIDIHLEGIKKERFFDNDPTKLLREILTRNVPVVLSLPPWMENYWMESEKGPETIELAREVVKRPGSFLGQQGNMHRCSYPHGLVDPWHENYCLWGPRKSAKEQRNFMTEGRDRLSEFMDVEPKVYCPPNHLWDNTTLHVADEMGYTHVTDKAMIPLAPYRFGGLIVVPEGDMRKGDFMNAAAYIHYDELDSHREFYRQAMQGSISLADITPERVSQKLIDRNRRMKHMHKIARDLVRMPQTAWRTLRS
ncbi:MAG: hypothetical protein ABH864_05010 [archaeon]